MGEVREGDTEELDCREQRTVKERCANKSRKMSWDRVMKQHKATEDIKVRRGRMDD